ncbi:MFS transporter [Lapillicoccus sp.]|uniref:MFS transporter n=1 Tax=Lapillicoccus sp. TaxID=1909287 RepID=UPI0025CB89B0|nr:MFS transporter [Lapillicoccus sp.]
MSLAARVRSRFQGEASPAFDRRLIAPMILGSILNPINSSIIAVSLVPIGLDLGAPPSQTAWLVSALYLATAIGQPVVGRLVDLYGPRPLYLVGTAMVGLAGLGGVLAPSLWWLVAARVLLGFGTCAGYPAAMFLIRSEAERTGKSSPAGVLTLLAVSSQTIAVIGPTLGGLLIGLGGWRSTMAVNIPLSLACLVLGARRLPRGRAATPSAATSSAVGGLARFDLPGIGLFAVTLVAALLFLMEPHVSRTWLVAVAVAAAVAFTRVEGRAASPFIDLRILRGNRPLVTTYARNLLSAIVSYAFLYGFTQWLEAGRGLSPSQAGLLLLPMFVTAIAVSSTTGRRPQIRGKLVVGGVASVVGCALLLLVSSTSAIWLLVVVVLVIGVPQGLVSLANQNAVYHQASPERMGSSAGLLRTSLYLGAIIASAANGAFLGQGADTAGLHELAAFTVVVGALMLVVTFTDRSLAAVGRPPT